MEMEHQELSRIYYQFNKYVYEMFFRNNEEMKEEW